MFALTEIIATMDARTGLSTKGKCSDEQREFQMCYSGIHISTALPLLTCIFLSTTNCSLTFLVLCDLQNWSIDTLHKEMVDKKKKVLKLIRNKLIVIRRAKGAQIVLPTDIHYEGADKTYAYNENKLKITVQMHYFVKKVKLAHPSLPLFIEHPSPNHSNYYPAELLTIYPDIVYHYP